MKTFVDLLNHNDIDTFDLLHEDDNFKFFGLKEEAIRRRDGVGINCFVFSKETKQFLTNYWCYVKKYNFYNLYKVERVGDYKCQFMDLEGNFLFDDWAEFADIYECRRLFKDNNNLLKIYFCDDKLNIHYNIWSNQNNKIVFDEWFDDIIEIDKESNCIVVYNKNKGYNVLNNKCEYLSTKWFERFFRTDGYDSAKICFYYKGMWLYLNNNGKLIYGDAIMNDTLNNLWTKFQ